MSPVRPTVTVIGRRLAPEDHRLRDFLTRIAQPFEWLEAGTPEADAALARRGRELELPVVLDGGEVIAGASPERVADAWRVSETPTRSHYDLAIVGAGPAGLAAAVYAASDGLSTILIDRDVPGGQASHTSLIENFIGFPDGIGGAELARLAGRQAERFGAELSLMRGVTGHSRNDDGTFTIALEGGFELRALAIVAAPGMEWRRLEVEGVEQLLGRGVYYGAGRSEAAQCGGDDVVVVGAGNSAGQAVMNLAQAGARVKMLVRGDRLGKTMSAYLVDRIAGHPLIDLRLRTQVAGIEAVDGQLAGVTVRAADGRTEQLPARALFLCLGGLPRTGWAEGSGVRVDRAGFILCGPDLLDRGERPGGWPLARDPLALETSVPGLFAAGDVRHGSTKRVGAAAGDGAMAVALVHRRLEELADEALARFRRAAAERALERRPIEDMPAAALAALTAGADGPSLARLAGMEGASWSELEPVLAAATAEIGGPADRGEAMALIADEWLERVAAGTVEPREDPQLLALLGELGGDYEWFRLALLDLDILQALEDEDRLRTAVAAIRDRAGAVLRREPSERLAAEAAVERPFVQPVVLPERVPLWRRLRR